jgi:hypothetical protein
MPDEEVLRVGSKFHPQTVMRRGSLVLRDATPWTSSVHALLRHLEESGAEAPRVVESGIDTQGRETLTFIEGEALNVPQRWSLEGSAALGGLLRRFHLAVNSFVPPREALWFPWNCRQSGHPSVIGHCDLGPWNIVSRDGMPVAFIDWARAGPVDPLVELAQLCWLNGYLHHDGIEDLAPLAERLQHFRAIVDGYKLPTSMRSGFIDLMIEVAVRSAADDADQATIRKGSRSVEAPDELVWALAWQIRDAVWLMENKAELDKALV